MIELLGRVALARLVLRAVERQPESRLADADRTLSDPRLLSFARGLSIGALVGAAVAGSALWGAVRRRYRRRRVAIAIHEA
jgi:hypothetical protein